MDTFIIKERKGPFEILAQVNNMGNDLQVNLLGGKAHIGAIGIGEARSSLRDPGEISATSSVFTFVSHKEDAVVKPMAEELAKRLKRKVVVVAGIHWDGLEMKDIEEIMAVCKAITDHIVRKVAKE
ncbi:MAG: hypothetical protein C0392_14865 [Syntrophus sp. (in: bacteria)]|nr:hypothetical protein [Syntrophus sp. (in: bacteria)]